MSLEQAFPSAVAGSRRLRRALRARRRLIGVVLLASAAALSLRAVQPPAAPSHPVVVAAHAVGTGGVLGADDLRLARYPDGAVPEGALTTLPAAVGRRVTAGLSPGEPLTAARLLDDDARAAPGRVALAVRLPDAGLAGLLRPGERIDLLATDARGGGARTVASDVVVLALPPRAASGPADEPGRPVVLEVASAEVADVTDAAVRLFLSWAWVR